jgi:hypothetical protein
MRYLLKASGIAAAVTFAVFAPGAIAQETSKSICQAVGADGAPEPLGDRDGHAISVTTETCRVEGGALAGALVTGQAIWEWDGTSARLVSVSGIARKPGATAAYLLTAGNVALTMADGKVTGFTASGKGRWPVASGSAATLAGKSFSFAAKSTGAGQWETDVTADVAAQ